MKKRLMLLSAIILLAIPGVSFAKIDGDCADCHTMHNSRAGAPMAFTSDGEASLTPFPVLLITDCIGCHAAGGSEAIADFNGSPIPQVYHNDAAKDLAGGNFAYIDGTKGGASNDRKGHNVVDILTKDATLTGPPGMGRGATTDPHQNIENVFPASSFTCAGNDGCHGARNRVISRGGGPAVKLQGTSAMAGAHHYNVDGQIDGTVPGANADDVYNSYRFLWGLYGTENTDPNNRWQNATSTSHNEYFGVNGSPFVTGTCKDCHAGPEGANTDTVIDTPSHSISGFCATCHGTFHQDTDASGSFIRHPTDYALPDKTEYSLYTSFNITGPVARTTLPANGTASELVTPGGGIDVVMCLSCHVAHGSNFAGMLRFDYEAMVAGEGENGDGCFACHTTKDTGTPDWNN